MNVNAGVRQQYLQRFQATELYGPHQRSHSALYKSTNQNHTKLCGHHINSNTAVSYACVFRHSSDVDVDVRARKQDFQYGGAAFVRCGHQGCKSVLKIHRVIEAC